MSDPVSLTLTPPLARLTFTRPEALNAINVAMAEAFESAVSQVLAVPGIRVLILQAEGRAFVAGGDLGAFHLSVDPVAEADAIISPMNRALAALHASDVLVLALVQGAAAGAGLSLVLGADFALASDSASFTFAYLKIGAPADCGITWALPRIVGLRRALWLAIEGSTLRSDAALAMGLVNEVVPADLLATRGEELARKLAGNAPGAAGALKRLLRDSFGADYATTLEAEKAAFLTAAAHPDFAEAIGAFLQKRPPRFSGT